MKNLTSNNELAKYSSFAIFIICSSFVYIICDFSDWILKKDKFIFDLNVMPMYRRVLSNIYILIWGYGGYLLLKRNNKSWDMIIIAMTSIIPSFIIIPKIWGVSFYVNWIVDFPFLLWYLFSLIVIGFMIAVRRKFSVKKWILRFSIILFVNVFIRILYESLFHKFI